MEWFDGLCLVRFKVGIILVGWVGIVLGVVLQCVDYVVVVCSVIFYVFWWCVQCWLFDILVLLLLDVVVSVELLLLVVIDSEFVGLVFGLVVILVVWL